MDAKTFEALKGSIQKWERIVEGTGRNYGAVDCPLCELFNRYEHDLCAGCPVSESTGRLGCGGTPYENYRVTGTTEAAQAELDFLKSLLPEESK